MTTLPFTYNNDPSTITGATAVVKTGVGKSVTMLTLTKDGTNIWSLSFGNGDCVLTDAQETSLGNGTWYYDVSININDGSTVVCATDQKFIVSNQAVNAAQRQDIQDTGIPVFSNNAGAISGGLVAGKFYRSGADPDTLYVVH